MPIRGIIFDLDGTLVDSGLDFDAMRREMDLPRGVAILEAVSKLPHDRASHCRAILDRHEREGAQRATLIPGVREFLAAVAGLGLRQALLTRNSREMTLLTLARLELRFDPVVTREDAPAKPDPAAIRMICERWGLPPGEVVMLGDFYFDVKAGNEAGARSVLYTAGQDPGGVVGSKLADRCLHSFHEASELLTWLAAPD